MPSSSIANSCTSTSTYEVCDLPELACPVGSACLADDVNNPMFGVCSPEGCVDAMDCPMGPVGGTVACGDITGTGQNLCFLECMDDAGCPVGATCLVGAICVFPV